MLFRPESKDTADVAKRKPGLLSRLLKRMVSLAITLVILGGVGYVG
jgi:membrane fusion protein, multidrug efflux system